MGFQAFCHFGIVNHHTLDRAIVFKALVKVGFVPLLAVRALLLAK